MFKKSLFLLIGLASASSPSFGGQCDVPWLNNNCQLKCEWNPESACRYAEEIKAAKKDPYDPLFIPSFLGIMYVESFERMATELCTSFKKMKCASIVNELYTGYTQVLNTYLEQTDVQKSNFVDGTSADQFDLTLERNFESLVEQNAEIIKQIDSELSGGLAASKTIKTLAEYEQFESNIKTKFQELRDRSIKVSEKERRFDYLTEQMVTKIQSNGVSLLKESVGYECDFKGEFSTEKYNVSLALLLEVSNKVRSEVQAASFERGRLMRLAYYKLRYFAFKKYAEGTKEKVEEILKKLNHDIWLSRLLLDFGEWWVNISVNGMANRLHTKYYNYSEPLRLLRSQHEVAKSYIARVVGNPQYDPETESLAVDDMKLKASIIDDTIKEIEGKGWKYYSDAQVKIAKSRATSLPNVKVCQDAVKVYLDASIGVKDLSDVDRNNPLFKNVIDFCVRQGI